MYQLILATVINDAPTLSIEECPDGRALYDQVHGRIDLDNDGWNQLVDFVTEGSAPGARLVLRDGESEEPVAVVVRL